jgi:hypothetical protein
MRATRLPRAISFFASRRCVLREVFSHAAAPPLFDAAQAARCRRRLLSLRFIFRLRARFRALVSAPPPAAVRRKAADADAVSLPCQFFASTRRLPRQRLIRRRYALLMPRAALPACRQRRRRRRSLCRCSSFLRRHAMPMRRHRPPDLPMPPIDTPFICHMLPMRHMR